MVTNININILCLVALTAYPLKIIILLGFNIQLGRVFILPIMFMTILHILRSVADVLTEARSTRYVKMKNIISFHLLQVAR